MADAPDARVDRVEIGRCARAHGIRGEVLIVPHDPASDVLAHVGELWLGARAYEVTGARPVNQGWLIALAGVATRTDAEALRGAAASVARDALDLDDGDVLLADLVGCRVVRAGGAPWGEVVAIEPGPQDRLVVHDGAVERLVPVAPAWLVAVDLAGRVVTVACGDDWPESAIDPGARD